MREATTATASPVDTGSDRQTRVLLAVGCVMLAGLIYAVVVRDEAVSCPHELIGAWVTSAKGYEDGMIVFTKTGVAFSVGAEQVDAQAVRRLEVFPDGPRTLYTVIYGDSRRDEQTITFKNQSHLVWTRKTMQS
ncbi:MAG: hypothetical protein E8D40_16765 [Nitrospira sp.]|nr:MAG: hypothetical protein E8D40_16765 [Nitrospira sp.]